MPTDHSHVAADHEDVLRFLPGRQPALRDPNLREPSQDAGSP
jgi:hypothetical protein